MALEGDTLVVGARSESGCGTGVGASRPDTLCSMVGAAYVFGRTPSADEPVWREQAYIEASNTDRDDAFGASVALGEKTLVVGASGEASCATEAGGDQDSDACPVAGAVYVRRIAP